MISNTLRITVGAVALCFGVGPLAQANTFLTPTGSQNLGVDVSAQATFTFSEGSFTLVLDNLAPQLTITSVLSGLQFELSESGPLTMVGSFGNQVVVNADGSVTDVADGPTAGWGFGTFGSGYIVCAICGGNASPLQAPTHTIIGPGTGAVGTPYSTANNGFRGGGGDAHEPFNLFSATFQFSADWITESTTASNVVFSFNTEFGQDIAGEEDGNVGAPIVPEPGTWALMGTALVAVAAWKRRRRSV
jgi:hypothetical protein